MQGTEHQVGQVSPADAWTALQDQTSQTLLIDVRTRAEWSFVGVPDLSQLGQQAAFIEWQSFPTMEMNGAFTSAAVSLVEQSRAKALYFLCRSGVRSHHAAVAMAAACSRAGHDVACINVAEGFEGDVNGEGRRGEMNGWKAHGLPWRQS
jgi:rhodanese-related sulfurtransferase